MILKRKCKICDKYLDLLDKHHIISKCYGGSNSKNNTVYICPNCHRDIHLGNIIVEGYYNTTKGRMFIWRYKDEPSITGNVDPKVYIIENK